MSRLLPLLRPSAEHLVATVMVLVALVPWLGVSSVAAGRIGVWGGAAVAILVSLVLARWRHTTVSVEVAISGGLLVAFLLGAVLRDPLAVLDLARGLRDGLPRILSTTLPILDVRWAGVPGALVAWSLGGVVTSLTARSRGIALPVGAALVAFLGGYAVTLGGSGGDAVAAERTPALALAVLIGAFAALRVEQAVPRGQRLRLVGRLSLAGVIVLGSVGAAAALTTRVPYLVDDPVQPRLRIAAIPLEPTSPLLVARELRSEQPDAVVGTVRVAGEWSGYVPLAVLDRYDGRVWGVTRDRFDPTGGLLPVELPVSGGGRASFESIDVVATGGWLPFVGRAASIAGTSVLHNGGGAFQLADAAEVASYQLQLSQPSLTLRDESLPDDAVVARGSTTGLNVPAASSGRNPYGEQLCRLLSAARDPGGERQVAGAPCGERGPVDVAFLRELSVTLRDGRAVQADLVGGRQLDAGSESLADLLDLVSQRGTQAAVGTPEQFSAAYALILEDFGLPVRLVTGFRVEEPVSTVAQELTGSQAWTWVEVPIEGHGWVVVEASPSAEDELVEEEQETAESVEEEEREVQDQERSVVGVDTSQVIGRAPPVDEGGWRIPLAAASPLLLAALLVAVTAARRGARRHRRRSGDPRTQVIGAWHELIDGLYDAGLREVEALSAEEIVDAASSRAPAVADPLAALADVANRAIFSTRDVEGAEVMQTWSTMTAIRRELRRSSSRRDRLRALSSPAPLQLTDADR